MAVTALHGPAAEFVPEQVRRALRHCLALVRVAGQASLVFGALGQQLFRRLGVVDGVARQATNIGGLVVTALPEGPVMLVVVARKALRRRFGEAHFPRVRDFGRIARFGVGGNVTVAGSATLILGCPELVGLAVWRRAVLLDDVFMASCALGGERLLRPRGLLRLDLACYQ